MEEEGAARPTRRELLGRARRAAVAATTAATATVVAGPTAARAANTDADWLATALEAERLSVIAYRHVLGLRGLTPHERRTVRRLLAHERTRAEVLAGDLRALGASVPSPPRTLAQVGETLDRHGMHGGLTGSSAVKDGLQLLLDIEALCEGALYRAVGNLAAVGPLVHAAELLAGHAQHTTILQGLLHPGDVSQAVSGWYVTGVA